MALYHDEGPPRAGQKVLLATTSYDNPDASYTFAIHNSRSVLESAGIQSAYLLISGNCHVDDARNQAAQIFLASDCTDLVFLDADVSWQAEDLVRLCQHDCDIVGGVYPYRREDKPDAIPARLIDGAPIINGLVEVEGLPTGFMRIRREVIEQLASMSDKFDTNDGRGDAHILYERTLEGRTRWGGDLNFCNRWRRLGGKIYADYEAVLGHTGKVTVTGSLGSQLRRINHETLKHICDKIKTGTDTLADYKEAERYIGNPWGMEAETLGIIAAYAKQANGPIIESGSGLSTILMAAATSEMVFCIEHDPLHAEKLRQMAREAQVNNIGLCVCPIKGNWYDLTGKTLPAHFAFGLNDGPPRQVGSREVFMQTFGGRCDVILCDDANTSEYRNYLTTWAGENHKSITIIEPRAAVLRAA